MRLWWLLVGAILSGPLWVAVTLWAGRRIWLSARRLAARAKGHEHLVELAQLVGGLTHEIKNPLSTIKVNLKLLAEDLHRYRDDEHRRLERRLNNVQKETDRLKGILEEFLRFAGKYELSLSTTDLRQVIGELADFFAPQADAAGAIMRISLPDSEARCNVDANLIKQALLNLMINAVQAMVGGGELLIRLSVHRRNAIIEVIDTGPGISREDLPKIFDAYYSTRTGGSGLGLPITRRIIQEHHGTIRADSEVDKGTRFVISLPLSRQVTSRGPGQ